MKKGEVLRPFVNTRIQEKSSKLFSSFNIQVRTEKILLDHISSLPISIYFKRHSEVNSCLLQLGICVILISVVNRQEENYFTGIYYKSCGTNLKIT